MSSALGLAATAAALQQLLVNGFAALKLDDVLGGTPTVSCIAPDRIDLDANSCQLNLFLYNQTRNPGWANQGLPSRDSRGERIANPPLALDLHFLLSAYGVADFQAEILLGAAMQILHETPGLGREGIRAALKPGANKPNLPKELELAGLADQVEQLRITPLNHNTDELSRIWSAIQVPARPSAAYLISVLLQESSRSARTPLPVRSRNLYALPLRAPRLDRVEALDGAAVPILPSSLLSLSGANLKAPQVLLRVNGLDLTGALQQLDNDRLEFGFLLPPPVPGPPVLAPGLRAGVCTVQVVHPQLMGSPAVAHRGVESNLQAFVLNPEANFTVEPGGISTPVNGVIYRSGVITVNCTPAVDARQRVRLLLNELAPPNDRPPHAYSFALSDGNGIVPPAESSTTLSIAYRQVVQGNYLARLQVDAGSSPLQVDGEGRFSGPQVAP
ncbi:MAG: DUF4255 domain-containing protein [Pseudomonas sp.]|uniref:DUF4255 domain-containing protein n=1 Tax=Pseudomonas sp. TaxID=306 RepID=UPI003397859C